MLALIDLLLQLIRTGTDALLDHVEAHGTKLADCAHHLAHGIRAFGHHVRRAEGRACAVAGQNTGHKAAGLFQKHGAGKDEAHLRFHLVAAAVGEENDVILDHDGDDDAEQTHGQNMTEQRDRLHDKGHHPLLGLVAIVQRHHGHEGRGDQIQEHHVEYTGCRTEHHAQILLEECDAEDDDQKVMPRGKAIVKIPVCHGLFIDIPFTVKIRLAEVVHEAHVAVILAVAGGTDGAYQHDQTAHIKIGIHAGGTLEAVGFQRLQLRIVPDLIHGVEQSFVSGVTVAVDGHLGNGAAGGDIIEDGLPAVRADRFIIDIVAENGKGAGELGGEIVQIFVGQIIPVVDIKFILQRLTGDHFSRCGFFARIDRNGYLIGILEGALLSQEKEILHQIVITGIQIITGVIGFIQRIVADGVDTSEHCAVLLI